MYVAVISDIHGNLVALDAVLQELAHEHIDHIICLRDVAAGGPQPRQVLARLQELSCPVVMGNTDDWLLSPQIRAQSSQRAQYNQDIELWCAQQLSENDKAYISSFQPTLPYALGGGKTLLAYHGSPRSYRERLLATTPDDILEQAFSGCHANVMVGGHTHIPMYRRYRDMLVLNPGSVGLALDRVWPQEKIRNTPWAEYTVIQTTKKNFSVELRRVTFDIQAFFSTMHSSGMPHPEWAAGEWICN